MYVDQATKMNFYLVEISGSVESFDDVLVEMRGPVFLVGPHEELEGKVVDVSSCDNFICNGVIVFEDFFLLLGKHLKHVDCERYLTLKQCCNSGC